MIKEKLNTKKRRILVDIGHPAHVHLFKNFIKIIEGQGHKVFVLIKDVDSIKDLLIALEIPYTVTQKKPDSLWLKYFTQITITIRTLNFVKKNKIEIGIGSSMTLSLISRLTNITTFGLDDDDTKEAPIAAWFLNGCNYVLTPNALSHENRGINHIVYPSYHELAYLHPNRFKPDPLVLKEANIKPGETYFVLRFNAFKAHHDISAVGLSYENKQKLIKLLSLFGKVFVTTERQTEPAFEPLKIPVSVEKIHSFLHFATMFIGDSQTMTTEAAVLGTPSFKCNSFAGKLSIPNELENKYHLCFSYLPDDFNKMLSDIENLLKMEGLKEVFAERRENMLQDKVDLTSFLVEMINGFPESVREVQNKKIFIRLF